MAAGLYSLTNKKYLAFCASALRAFSVWFFVQGGFLQTMYFKLNHKNDIRDGSVGAVHEIGVLNSPRI